MQTKQSKPSLLCVVYVCACAHTCVYAYIKFPEHADNALCNFSNSMCSGIVFLLFFPCFCHFPVKHYLKNKQSPGNSDVKESRVKLDNLFSVTYFIVCLLNEQ